MRCWNAPGRSSRVTVPMIVILNERPSRKLSKRFLCCRGFDVDGDDESSDIRIATHGLDSAYDRRRGEIVVRQLSTCSESAAVVDEMFARDGWLIPRRTSIQPPKPGSRDAINARPSGNPSGNAIDGTSALARSYRAKCTSHGRRRPQGAAPPVESETTDGADANPPPPARQSFAPNRCGATTFPEVSGFRSDVP